MGEVEAKMRTETSSINRCAEHGYTLLEVLITITILSLLALNLGSAMSGGRSRAMLSDSQSVLDEALVLARSTAQTRGATTFVRFDLAGRRLQISTSSNWRILPREISISLVTAYELIFAGMPAVAFLPDGTSSGGDITMSIGTQHVVRRIDWLTGALLDGDA